MASRSGRGLELRFMDCGPRGPRRPAGTRRTGCTISSADSGWMAVTLPGPPDDGLAREYHAGTFIFSQFVAHRKALVRAVAETAADSLSRELDPPGEERYNPLGADEDNPLFGYKTLLEMIANMALYTAQLAGELCILRRSLGLPIEDNWPL
jgi:hypothetical protein